MKKLLPFLMAATFVSSCHNQKQDDRPDFVEEMNKASVERAVSKTFWLENITEAFNRNKNDKLSHCALNALENGRLAIMHLKEHHHDRPYFTGVSIQGALINNKNNTDTLAKFEILDTNMPSDNTNEYHVKNAAGFVGEITSFAVKSLDGTHAINSYSDILTKKNHKEIYKNRVFKFQKSLGL